MLIIFGGLPGTGKTTTAKETASRLSAVYLRIDTIEQALIRSGSLCTEEMGGAGYFSAYAVAADNLKLGHTVVADSVNPLFLTREAWRRTALEAHCDFVEIEIICSNPTVHRQRIETRQADIAGMRLPSWQEVIDREYEVWDKPDLVLDTSEITVEETVSLIEKFCLLRRNKK